MKAELKVELLSKPLFLPPDWYDVGDGNDGEELAEFAGRECYQSWGRPNPDTATNEGYLSNIIDHRHFSVLEHANYTVRISGVSRSLTHELVRHRHFSYSQLSQRYVDEGKANHVIPPVIRDVAPELEATLARSMLQSLIDYRYIYSLLVARGASRKEARGAARAVLPQMTETIVVVTGNLRTFREFFEKRVAEGVDQEIVELGQHVFDVLYQQAPNAFQDAPEWYKSGGKIDG